MNREIKFRAWGYHNFDLDEEFNLVSKGDKHFIHIGLINGLDEMHSNPSKLIFQQCTGLKIKKV